MAPLEAGGGFGAACGQHLPHVQGSVRAIACKKFDNNTFRCYMHMSTQSVYITTNTCKPQMDVYCIYGCCGAERSGQWRWTLTTMAAVRHRPTFNDANANPYVTKKQRKQLAKERAKGKAVVGKHSTTREERRR